MMFIQQAIDSPMGTIYAPLVADLFPTCSLIYTRLLKYNEKRLALSFNLKFRYAVDVISLNNSKFCDYVEI